MRSRLACSHEIYEWQLLVIVDKTGHDCHGRNSARPDWLRAEGQLSSARCGKSDVYIGRPTDGLDPNRASAASELGYRPGRRRSAQLCSRAVSKLLGFSRRARHQQREVSRQGLTVVAVGSETHMPVGPNDKKRNLADAQLVG
jgi:hypothetical protein